MTWSLDFWVQRLREILVEDVANWLPTLGIAILLVLIGLMAARLAQFVIGGLLRRIKVDRLGEKAGAAQLLEDLGMETSVSGLVARLIYWLVLLLFILAAAESLGMEGVTATLRGLVEYLPKVLAAALILLLGAMIARLVGNTLGALADRSGVRGGLASGQVARYVILAFVVVLALEQLGVETTLLVNVTTALVVAVVLAIALSFGWGSRELAHNIMAGFHLRETFVIGQRLAVRGHRGKLTGIGPIKAILETEEGTVSIPNAALLEDEVIILRAEKETDGTEEKS